MQISLFGCSTTNAEDLAREQRIAESPQWNGKKFQNFSHATLHLDTVILSKFCARLGAIISCATEVRRIQSDPSDEICVVHVR